MKVYHGERTRDGCRVTVDGVPLRVCSDLSGAIAPFDWGYVGNGQLSLALLSDLLGDGQRARALCKALEREVLAELPHDAWTLTEAELVAALSRMASRGEPGSAAESGGARDAPPGDARPDEADGRAAFGDMPVETGGLFAHPSDTD